MSVITCSQWKLAMDEEFTTLQRNHTWKLVPPAPLQNLVGTKWIYKIKHDVDGHVQLYKAHLVAKCYLQQPDIEYGSCRIFAPNTIS